MIYTVRTFADHLKTLPIYSPSISRATIKSLLMGHEIIRDRDDEYATFGMVADDVFNAIYMFLGPKPADTILGSGISPITAGLAKAKRHRAKHLITEMKLDNNYYQAKSGLLKDKDYNELLQRLRDLIEETKPSDDDDSMVAIDKIMMHVLYRACLRVLEEPKEILLGNRT